ncbi:hypothetical protein AB4Y44_20395 [Paraburkholderia sp. BR10937]
MKIDTNIGEPEQDFEFERHMKRDRAKALRAELFALTGAAVQ